MGYSKQKQTQKTTTTKKQKQKQKNQNKTNCWQMIRPFTAVDIILGKKYYEVNFFLERKFFCIYIKYCISYIISMK
jgi:hypothetical protein